MRVRLALVALPFLAACALTAEEESCAAADYATLLGTNIAAVTLPSDPDLRIFAEGDPVTQDYRPERTNIVFSDSGTITQVYCG